MTQVDQALLWICVDAIMSPWFENQLLWDDKWLKPSLIFCVSFLEESGSYQCDRPNTHRSCSHQRPPYDWQLKGLDHFADSVKPVIAWWLEWSKIVQYMHRWKSEDGDGNKHPKIFTNVIKSCIFGTFLTTFCSYFFTRLAVRLWPCYIPCVGRCRALCVLDPVLHTVAPFLPALLAGTLFLAAGSGPYCCTKTHKHD